MNKQKKLKKIPKFSSKEEEAIFWDTHDSTDYIDWSRGKLTIFPNLKVTVTRPIPIRLSQELLASLKYLANKYGIGYQALIRSILAEGIRNRLRHISHK